MKTNPFKRWTAAQTFIVATLALGSMSGLCNDVQAQDGHALLPTNGSSSQTSAIR